MSWYLVTIAPPIAGKAIAADLLSRANNPTTWSFESLGALVFRDERDDADRFFFSPQAALLFEPLIAANDGQPCDSPLLGTLVQGNATRLTLGFKTRWEPVKRPERKQRAGWELRP